MSSREQSQVEFLSSKVVQLRRQVAFYEALTAEHQLVLKEVHDLLQQDERPKILEIQRRIASIVQKQVEALEQKRFCDDGDSWDPKVDAREPPASTNNAQYAVNVPTVAATRGTHTPKPDSDAAAMKIQSVCVRLLNLWYHHVKEKAKSYIVESDRSLEDFHASPSSETLESFVSTYEKASSGISLMFDEEDPSTEQLLGPIGNPFRLDGRLKEIIRNIIAEGATPTPVGSTDRPDTRGPLPKALRATPLRTDDLRPPSATHKEDNEHLWPPDVVPSSRLLPPQRLVPPSSNTATPRSLSTPGRHNTTAQDSTQMRGLLSAAPPPSIPRPTSKPTGPMSNLDALNNTLRSLEMQLSTVRTGSGSEARYYALSKKLQRVRAEVLKEQRAQEEVTRIAEEREEVWKARK